MKFLPGVDNNPSKQLIERNQNKCKKTQNVDFIANDCFQISHV